MLEEWELNKEIEETRRVLDTIYFDGSLESVITIITARTTLRTLLLVKGLTQDEVTDYMNERFDMIDHLSDYQLIVIRGNRKW